MVAHGIKGRQSPSNGIEKSSYNVLKAEETEFYEWVDPNWVSKTANEQILLTGSPVNCSDNGKQFNTYQVDLINLNIRTIRW